MNADETIRQIGNVTLRGIGARDVTQYAEEASGLTGASSYVG